MQGINEFLFNLLSEIDMTRLIAEQSSTPDAHGKASNAIDGNVRTLSKAYGTKVEAVAWWKVDMRMNYFVRGLSITSAENQYGGVNNL